MEPGTRSGPNYEDGRGLHSTRIWQRRWARRGASRSAAPDVDGAEIDELPRDVHFPRQELDPAAFEDEHDLPGAIARQALDEEGAVGREGRLHRHALETHDDASTVRAALEKDAAA